jgi:hypothetical protein
MSIYVQHKSGQGDIWEVYPIPMDMKGWSVRAYLTSTNYNEYRLPKSEYVEVPAPEVWEDVSGNCELIINARGSQQIWHGMVCIDGALGYRFKKVTLWTVQPGTNILGEAQDAFVVERKQS